MPKENKKETENGDTKKIDERKDQGKEIGRECKV